MTRKYFYTLPSKLDIFMVTKDIYYKYSKHPVIKKSIFVVEAIGHSYGICKNNDSINVNVIYKHKNKWIIESNFIEIPRKNIVKINLKKIEQVKFEI